MQTCINCPHLPSKPKRTYAEIARMIGIGQKVVLTVETLMSEPFNHALEEVGLISYMLEKHYTVKTDFDDDAPLYIEPTNYPNERQMTVALYEFPADHQGTKTYMALTNGEDMPYSKLAVGCAAFVRHFPLEALNGSPQKYPPYRNQMLHRGDRVLILAASTDPSVFCLDFTAV